MSLVTIGICTYNSSKYITETLDSCVKQTYKDIELILSDDASKDDTLEKVEDWLSSNNNRSRFKRVKVIQVETNTGLPANANRVLAEANGCWIKYIGADDVLLPDCIGLNVEHVKNNPEVKVLFSKLDIYNNDFNEGNFLYTTPSVINEKSILWNGRNAEDQYKMLLVSDRIHFTPTVFLHTDTLKSFGGFDVKFKLLEDYPLWLRYTGSGVRLYFMNKKTVLYRRHIKAINNTEVTYVVNPNYFRHESFRREYTYPYLPIQIRLCQRFAWYMSLIFKINWFNKKNAFNMFMFNLLTIYFNPFRYWIWFMKRVGKNELAYEGY